MGFANVQIGGSMFEHAETRQKAFTTDASPEGHEKFFDEILAYVTSIRDATRILDHDRATEKNVADAIKMHNELHIQPGSVEPMRLCILPICRAITEAWPDVVRRLEHPAPVPVV